jgi:hypothetical protein
MENITRISDLPDNIISSGNYNVTTSAIPTSAHSNNSGVPTNYIPINIHPNPYGISTQNPIMQHPEQPDFHPKQNELQIKNNQQNQYISEEQIMQMQNQRLPSRDIPQDTSEYIQDEQIKPNYIPKVRFEEDYVRKHEDMTERNLRDYEEKNKREKKMDILFNELQTPIFIAILFFFFQIPLVNLFFKRFSFLSIYNPDGNFNFNGLLLKSIIFGSAYYTFMKIINFGEL